MARIDELPQYLGCPDVSKYEKMAKIGQGTFGVVFKAKQRSTKKLVALKRVMMENQNEGFPITSLREIRILQLLKHDNIVNLIEICQSKANPYSKNESTFYLVLDFCEHDLAGLLSNRNVRFTLGEKKMVMKQMLEGLFFIHTNKILHRDMKAANILITKHGQLKLADFGLSRAVKERETYGRYTNRVITLWYRPPEILLGDRNYSTSVDMWGAGCIMAELWTRSPIMQGKNEQEQLDMIIKLCGSINPETFPGVDSLELYTKLEHPQNERRKVRERLRGYINDLLALDLLDKFLTLNPTTRINGDNALDHQFFWEDPMPCDLKQMLAPHSQSMFEMFSAKKSTGPNQQPVARQQAANPTANDGQFVDRVF